MGIVILGEYDSTPTQLTTDGKQAKVRIDDYRNLSVTLGSMAACALVKGATVAENVTCTLADTDYAMASAMAAGTKYLVIYSSAALKVAMGAATSATNGVWVAAGVPTIFPVRVTGTAADDKCHVQSPSAGAVATFTSMAD